MSKFNAVIKLSTSKYSAQYDCTEFDEEEISNIVEEAIHNIKVGVSTNLEIKIERVTDEK